MSLKDLHRLPPSILEIKMVIFALFYLVPKLTINETQDVKVNNLFSIFYIFY